MVSLRVRVGGDTGGVYKDDHLRLPKFKSAKFLRKQEEERLVVKDIGEWKEGGKVGESEPKALSNLVGWEWSGGWVGGLVHFLVAVGYFMLGVGGKFDSNLY